MLVSQQKFNEVITDLQKIGVNSKLPAIDYLKGKVVSAVKKKIKAKKSSKKMSGGDGSMGNTVLPLQYYGAGIPDGMSGAGEHITSTDLGDGIARAGIPSSFAGGGSGKLRVKSYNVMTASNGIEEKDIKSANKMSNKILSYVVNYMKVHKKLFNKTETLTLTKNMVKHIFEDMSKDRSF